MNHNDANEETDFSDNDNFDVRMPRANGEETAKPETEHSSITETSQGSRNAENTSENDAVKTTVNPHELRHSSHARHRPDRYGH